MGRKMNQYKVTFNRKDTFGVVRYGHSYANALSAKEALKLVRGEDKNYPPQFKKRSLKVRRVWL